jgi:hypothetical protein
MVRMKLRRRGSKEGGLWVLYLDVMHEVMVATYRFHWQVACLDVRLRIGLASSSPGGERMRSDLCVRDRVELVGKG